MDDGRSRECDFQGTWVTCGPQLVLVGTMRMVDELEWRHRFRRIRATVLARVVCYPTLAELWCVCGCVDQSAVACVLPMCPSSTSCITCTPTVHAAVVLPRECRLRARMAPAS